MLKSILRSKPNIRFHVILEAQCQHLADACKNLMLNLVKHLYIERIMKRDDGQLLQPTKWRGSPSEGAADGSLPSEYCLMSHRKGAVLNNSLHFSRVILQILTAVCTYCICYMSLLMSSMGMPSHSVLTAEHVRLKCGEETLRLHDIQFTLPTFSQKLDSCSFKLLVGILLVSACVVKYYSVVLHCGVQGMCHCAKGKSKEQSTGRKLSVKWAWRLWCIISVIEKVTSLFLCISSPIILSLYSLAVCYTLLLLTDPRPVHEFYCVQTNSPEEVRLDAGRILNWALHVIVMYLGDVNDTIMGNMSHFR